MGRGGSDRERVTATWELSLTVLEEQGRAQARALLQILACFDSAVAVPPLLLDQDVLAHAAGSTSAAEEGLAGLASVGLISTRPVTGMARPGVKVHPLVAQTIRYQAGPALAGAMDVAVRLLAAASGQLRQDQPGDGGGWLALLPHLRALQLADVTLGSAEEEQLAYCATRVSIAMLRGGSYLAALDTAEAGLARSAGLGDRHLAVLRLRERRASAWRFLGRAAEAESEFRQILDARVRVLGPDNPDTLIARSDMARVLTERGKAAEAEAEFRHVLDAALRILGPDHPDTLITRHDIARALTEQGKATEAEAEFRQVLDAQQRTLGPGHPSALTTRHNIAYVLTEQGKTADAEAGYRQVLADRARVLGSGHPDTLTTRSDLAGLLARQGKAADAEAEYRQVLAGRVRVLGPGHPDTLATRNDITEVRRSS